MSELGDRLRTLGRQLEEARRDGELDPLTKVGNRRAFDERIERVTELSALSGAPSCLIFVDIDHFKAINDKHGHPTGDAVLARVADAISRAFLRKSDFVARYGGEEFAIIVHEVSLEASRKLTARLLERMRALTFDDLVPGLQVRVSVGVAELERGEMHGDWLERADRALYEAKSAGRDCIAEAASQPPRAAE
jgi:diguanylate cyclase (GGDEF)-like protein